MKKYIIFPLLACFALMACEKQEPTPPTQDQLEQKWPEKIETAEMGTFIKIQRDTTQSFYMGDNNSADPTEKPAHQVTFSKSFYMCTLEVTQAQWKAVMGSNPSKEIVGDNLPVNDVTLANVNDFIKKLNQQTGRSFRLPTEAEWEFAATGGVKSAGYTYAGSNDIDEVAWYEGNSDDTLHPVGLKKANELGLFDMSGNANEWCSDKCSPYKEDAQTDPVGSITNFYATRGGSFEDPADFQRTKARVGEVANTKRYSLGLRLVLSEPLSTELLP